MSAKKSPIQAPRAAVRSRGQRFGAVVLEGGTLLGGLGVALAMQPSSLNPYGPIKALVIALAVTSVLLGLALDATRTASGVKRLGRIKASFAVPAFLLIGALATLTSVNAEQSIVGHYPEYQGLLLVLGAATIGLGAGVLADDAEAWRRLTRAAALSTLVVSAIALQQVASAGGVNLSAVSRAVSTTGNASNLGVFLCLLLPITLSSARRESVLGWRAAAWAAFAAGSATLVLTLSRGAWVGAAAAAVVWLLYEGRDWSAQIRTRLWLLVGGGLLVVLVVGLLVVPTARVRLSEAIVSPTKGTLGWRIETWRITSGLVARRPLLGWGPASFRYSFPSVRTAATLIGESDQQIVDDPHNLVLSVAVQYGVIAVALLVWLVAGVLVGLWRSGDPPPGSRLRSSALAASIVGAFVALQAHFLTLDTWPLFALLVGWALGVSALSAAEKPEAAPAETGVTAVRWIAVAAGVLFAAVSLAAAGLVWSDHVALDATRLSASRVPWAVAAAAFDRSRSLAPWEPTMSWTMGRAATQRVDRVGERQAFTDGAAAFGSAAKIVPGDSLLPEQEAQLFVVAALRFNTPALAVRGLELARQAQRLDPQNGFRWETIGAAYMTQGDLNSARDALERAVALDPRDAQAWQDLVAVYGRLGDSKAAAKARGKARKAATAPVIRFQ